MVGTRNSKHVKSNLTILQFDLTQEDKETIRSFIERFPKADTVIRLE